MNLKNLFAKPEDKYLLQMNMVVGDGFNGGLSVNLPRTTDIAAMHEVADRMRRVLDRQRAIYELPVFQEKLDVLEAQLETTQKDVVKFEAEAAEQEERGGTSKTSTMNTLDNLKQNLEHLTAEVELGRSRVTNIRQRAQATEQSLDDIRKLNEMGVAA